MSILRKSSTVLERIGVSLIGFMASTYSISFNSWFCENLIRHMQNGFGQTQGIWQSLWDFIYYDLYMI